jgi:pyruvate/2-oxoglutarate/acetoin dehydrogenase E1 component
LGRSGGGQFFDLAAVHAAEVGECHGDVPLRRWFVRPAADEADSVVEIGQWVLYPRKKEEVHGRQEQERTPLEKGCIVEQRQHVVIVGDGAADCGVGGAAVTLSGLGEGSEVIAQRLISVHVV